MKKRTYKITLCGKTWRIRFKKVAPNINAEFFCDRQLINVSKDLKGEALEETLLHEIIEVILVQKDYRYRNDVRERDFFIFTHSEFANLCEDFYFGIKQLIRLGLLSS
jgi:hypothetical protein